MAEQPTYKFLPEDKCLTESQLFDYIDGKLKAPDMHFIEKHILSCAFCSDALEGLEKVKDRDKVAAFIPTTGTGKTAGKEEEKEKPKVIPLNPNRKYYALAAGLVLIIGITLFLKLSVSDGLENAKTAELVQNDTSVLMPSENQSTYADSLAQEKNAVTKTELGEMNNVPAADNKPGNSNAPATGGVTYFRTPALEERADKPQAKAAKEAEPDRNADGDDLDHFVNVVDEKTNEQQESNDKSKLKNEGFANIEQKQKPAETDKKNKDFNRSTEARTENEDVVLSEKKADVPPAPLIVSGTTTTNASGATPQTTSAPTYTWSGPASTNGTSVMTTDTILYTVTKSPSDRELDLSYENGVKMLAAGQATASLSLFDEVLKNPAHPHYQDAQWKKAEALIQLKRIEEAKKLLNEIAAKKGTYQEQAKAKLKTI
jgi:hypothetical protein